MPKTVQSKPIRTPKPPVSAPAATAEPEISRPGPVPRADSLPSLSESADKVERFAIPLDVNTGAIVLDSMRDSSRAKLLKAIKASNLGGDAPAVATSAENAALNAMIVTTLYDAIGSLAVIMARTRGFSADAAALMRYTDEEKQMFSGPTIAVLEKYDLLGGKYREEMLLLAAIGGVTVSHIMAMKAAEAKRAESAPAS